MSSQANTISYLKGKNNTYEIADLSARNQLNSFKQLTGLIQQFPQLSSGTSLIDSSSTVKYTIVDTINDFRIIDYNKNIIQPMNLLVNIDDKNTRLQFDESFDDDTSNWRIIIYGTLSNQIYNNATQLNDLQDVSIISSEIGNVLLYNGSKWVPSSIQIPKLDYVPISGGEVTGSLIVNSINITGGILLNGVSVNTPDGLVQLDQNGKIPDGLYTNQISGVYDESLQTLEIYGSTLSFINSSILDVILPIENNGTIEPNCHYQITMTQNTTLNAYDGVSGKIGAAQLLINPGSFTFTPGTNLTLVNNLIQNKVNYCTINWFGTNARMYVIDTFEAE